MHLGQNNYVREQIVAVLFEGNFAQKNFGILADHKLNVSMYLPQRKLMQNGSAIKSAVSGLKEVIILLSALLRPYLER